MKTAGQTGVAIALLLAATVPARSDDPVSSSVRYTGDIVRILDRRCLACHGADSVADPLTTYRQVRDWGRAIREEIVEQRMPPWSAARGYHRFQRDLALTSREMATLLSWLDGGMPRGDDRDLPKPADAPAPDEPDLRLRLPTQNIPALDEHVVRRVEVDTKLDGERLIDRVRFVPGRRSALRGAVLFVADGGHETWLAAWLPWQTEVPLPSNHAFRLPAGARLIVELHYRGEERDATDQPSIDLFFADAASPRRAALGELPVGTTAVTVNNATSIWALVPSADPAAKSLELTARKPDGTVDVLLWIPEYRHEWPQVLVLDTPVPLPRGSVLSLTTDPPGSGQVRAETRAAPSTATRAE